MATVILAIRSPGAIALIGAVAGVAGGVFGALAGGWSTYRIEAARQAFQRRQDLRSELQARERELSVVRGIARVWRTRLDDLRALLSDYTGTADGPKKKPQWWLNPWDLDTEMSVEDMKAVAAALTHDDWSEIDAALYGIRGVSGRRAWFFSRHSHDEFVEMNRAAFFDDLEDLDAIRDLQEFLTQAIAVLDSLSERLPDVEPST
jgi:hypothetical protein